MNDTKQIDWKRYGIYSPRALDMPADWVYVASIDSGGGYEWVEFHAFWSPTARRYFWRGDSGCSCNSWRDGVYGAGDFRNGDRFALIRAIREFAKEHDYFVSAAEALDAVAAVQAFKADR